MTSNKENEYTQLVDDLRVNINEDTFTTYKDVLEAGCIAVGNESKYTYKIRLNSISRSSFSKSSLDLIKATEKMTVDTLRVFPDLKPEVRLRRSWAYTSVLNAILTSNKENEYTQLVDDLRVNINEDTFTTYKDVLEAGCIAVGNESKYTYKIRLNSISRSSFSKSSLDLIKATEKMTVDTLRVFPDLKPEVRLRRSWAYTSVLNAILTSNKENEYTQLVDDLRVNIIHSRPVILSRK
ncbi:hypothetical protein WP50_08135, partial [Lactiplantibacillus plantarum]